MAGIAADAAERAQSFGLASATADADAALASQGGRVLTSNADAGGSTRRAFYRHVRALFEKADVLLEVLDARDPLSCRAPAMEALALAQEPPKRIVLVLNKIDLVPPEVVQKWLVYLRKEFPTVAFKASTQQQRSHLAAPGGGAVNKATEAGEVRTGSGAAGADTLVQLIKNYSRSHDLKRAVTVGVLGYPNVGKSSVINSLKRSKAVGVSAMPGFTKSLQEVQLDSKVTLIDCPGVIFDEEGKDLASKNGASASLLLRNCISVDQIEDPEGAVEGILRRCAREKLMALYAIPGFETTQDFLSHIAVKRGKVGKGGVPDREGAARAVLQDWNSGKIPFFVLPPTAEEEDEETMAGNVKGPLVTTDISDVGAATIVSDWTKVSTSLHHSFVPHHTRLSQNVCTPLVSACLTAGRCAPPGVPVTGAPRIRSSHLLKACKSSETPACCA
jgi:nuclear GTP-binding protein